MTKLHEPIDGCAAEISAGTIILVTALLGIPKSTSQVATGAIAGTAMAHRFGNVRWGVMGNIALAWIFTFAGAGVFGILTLLLMRPFL